MLTRHDDPTSALLPNLLFNRRVPPAPGALVSRRTAVVRHNVETTYVVPGDWPKADGGSWFEDGAPADGSDVEYLIEGQKAFEAMIEAMETATKWGHYIVLVAWSLDLTFPFARGKTFLQVVEERAKLGVAVRVLLWKNVLYGQTNENAQSQLNALRAKKDLDVSCVIDNRTKGWVSSPVATASGNKGVYSTGSHHHKIFLVHGDDGLVGFCGGIDIDPTRLSQYHDLHVRVRGAAAGDLLKIAEQRWANAKLDNDPPSPSTISPLSPPSFTAPPVAPYLARAVQTVGNPDITGVPNTLWKAVQRALQRASRFIYIEDQYFWSRDLVEALVEAAQHVKHITVLLPAPYVAEHTSLCQNALQHLMDIAGNGIEQRIGIFQHKSGPREWIHAKMFVIDDEYSLVGSANANNRGYFHDSEASVGVAERAFNAPQGARGGAWWSAEANFARRMRMKLWAEHLGLDTDELFDGVGARVHWDALPRDAKVEVYQAVDLKKGPIQRAPWYEAPYEDWGPGIVERARWNAIDPDP